MDRTQTTTNEEAQRLVDRRQVSDLVYRLGVCLDDGRFDEMPLLFVEAATAKTPGGTAEGRDALVAQAERNHSRDDRIQHVITNLLVDLEGDRAKVRANLVVHFAGSADREELAPPVRFSLGEVYRFEAARTPEGWRLSRVETIPVWSSGSVQRRPVPATSA
jgi:3-phenylpropionate/cinnamic acid dioxygenase small subunit